MTSYKNLETFQFKGITYRYLKRFNEWRRVDKTAIHGIPIMIKYKNGFWSARNHVAVTPQCALYQWYESLLGCRTVEAEEYAQTARDLQQVVVKMRMDDWSQQ